MLLGLQGVSYECSRLKNNFLMSGQVCSKCVFGFSFTDNKISDDSVQLEGCFIVNKKLRAQMKTIFYMFLLRVLVVVPYTTLCPPTTLSNQTTVWKALLKSFQQNGKHFSHAKNGSPVTEYRYKSEFQRWKKHKSLKASYTFFSFSFSFYKPSGWYTKYRRQNIRRFRNIESGRSGLVFLVGFSVPLAVHKMPCSDYSPWFALSFPHHQLNVKYGTILQNCSEMQFRKSRNMEKMQKKAHDN